MLKLSVKSESFFQNYLQHILRGRVTCNAMQHPLQGMLYAIWAATSTMQHRWPQTMISDILWK